jgi:arsenate reductase
LGEQEYKDILRFDGSCLQKLINEYHFAIVMSKSRVLFLCTGNSCRSQMAEAIVNARLGQHWQAFSAGSQPTGYVHPLAIKALAEIGIDHHGKSKSMDEFIGQSFDLVITLCEDSDDNCPVWLGKGRQLHRPFPDPVKSAGADEQVLQAFRQVRDDIASTLMDLLSI